MSADPAEPDPIVEYLDHVANGMRRRTAADTADIEWSTLVELRERNPEFAAAELDAETRGDDVIEQALFDTAASGNVEAIKVWLFNRRPGEWKDPRHVDLLSPDEREAAINASIADRFETAVHAILTALALTEGQQALVPTIVPRGLRLVRGELETGDGDQTDGQPPATEQAGS